MSEGLNRVVLIGNLGQDPELRFTQSNQGVLNISMATTESYFDSNTKERKERTEWHRVTVWGARGEALNKILSKGSRICVEGRLQTRSWEQDGQKRYSTDIVANNIILLGGGSSDRQESGEKRRRSGGGDDYQQQQPSSGSYAGDDDIPFARNEVAHGTRGEMFGKRII